MAKNKILVIDDNHEMRDMISDLLAIKGYRVETSETGTDITERLGTIEPDLIICDIAMPEKDGFEVLEDVRSSDHAQVPFVFLTASMVQSEQERIINTTADGYLMKPYDSQKLFKLLDELLDNSDTG